MTLLIRADASPEIGTGHVMRCLALAQGWQDAGGAVHFACAQTTPALADRIRDEGCGLSVVPVEPGAGEDLRTTLCVAERFSATHLAVDGYAFGADFQAGLTAAGLPVLFVDDYGHAGRYEADFVLNQNISASAMTYADRSEGTRLLLGPRYALLRRDFDPYRGAGREIAQQARRILVTLGGADPSNVTHRVRDAVARLETPDLETVIVLGGSNPHAEGLMASITDPRITFVRNVSDMPDQMSWADIAIASASSTSLELAFMGLPTILIVLADNQRPLALGWASAGAAWSLGWFEGVSEEDIARAVRSLISDAPARQRMAECGQAATDGWGRERVVAALCGRKLILRPAATNDCRLLFDWANDPVTRENSFNSDVIPWEGHQRWFAARLQDPATRLFIGETLEGEPVGQIRFDVKRDEAVLSVSVAPQMRGKGFGTSLIEEGCRGLLRSTEAARILAEVKPANTASLKALERAGFRRVGTEDSHGEAAIQLQYQAR